MKKEELFAVMTDVDDSFVAEAVPTRLPRKRPKGIGWLTAAACFLLIIGLGTAAFRSYLHFEYPDFSGALPVKQVSKREGYLPSAFATKWAISAVSFSGIRYQSNSYSCEGRTLDSEKIGAMLGYAETEWTGVGVDPLPGERVAVYRIAGISSACAVAVRYESGGDYVIYQNVGYFPESVGQWVEDLDLRSNAVFTSAFYSFTDDQGEEKIFEFTGLDPEMVWKALFGREKTPIRSADFGKGDIRLTVCMDLPLLDYENLRLCITEDGFVYADTPQECGNFRIGKITAQCFIKSVFERCKGYELVFDD
ncbi:MAG: hypothetical protein ACI4WZ_06455 [Eubacteriales bacterium]